MNYNQAKLKAATCQRCKLCRNRAQMVWSKSSEGEGPFFMFIGDAPSIKDTMVAVPFSDMSLDYLIK